MIQLIINHLLADIEEFSTIAICIWNTSFKHQSFSYTQVNNQTVFFCTQF